MNAIETTRRRVFRPKWWAVLLTLVFVIVTIRLGNWQGDRAAYKIAQQTQLDAAMKSTPLDVATLNASKENIATLRYRPVTARGTFDAKHLYFVDNKIQDGKAGYAVLQRLTFDGTNRSVFVERGWVAANADRAQLPSIDTPANIVSISGRINLPISRNPGTITNDFATARINYVNLEELQSRLGKALGDSGAVIEPYVFEQSAGDGFIAGTQRALPSSGHQKNLAYQVQWYAFAGLALILFLFFSFRRVDALSDETNSSMRPQ
jgi:surfeit locus 1 family protein